MFLLQLGMASTYFNNFLAFCTVVFKLSISTQIHLTNWISIIVSI